MTDWLGRVRREEESHTDGSEVWSWGQPVPPLIDSAEERLTDSGGPTLWGLWPRAREGRSLRREGGVACPVQTSDPHPHVLV